MKRTILTLIVSALCLSLFEISCSQLPAHLPDHLLSKPEDIIKVQSLLPCACADTSYVDLSPRMPPVQNQGNINDCVGWSLGYACRSYYHAMISNVNFYKGGQMDSSNLVSPYYIYNSLKNGSDSGINMLQALYFLKDTGTCTWNLEDSLTVYSKPDSTLVKDSITHALRVFTFNRVGYDTAVIPINEIRNALKCGDPVLVAVLYDVVYFRAGYNGAAKALWNELSNTSGNHAVVIVGYNDSTKCFKFMNSYGDSWGDKGYGQLSYSIAEKVIKEAYVLRPQSPSFAFVKTLQQALLGGANTMPQTSFKPRMPSGTKASTKPSKPPVPLPQTNSADSLIGNGMSLRIDSQSRSDIYLSIRSSDPLLDKALQGADSTITMYVRLFTVDPVGKASPLISKDPAHNLGNGQAAYKATYSKSGTHSVWSVDVAYQNLKGSKGKLRAEPLIYMGQQAVAAGKPVDFGYK